MVAALTRLQYQGMRIPDNMLCTFVDHVGKSVVLDQDMNKLIKLAVTDLKLEARGFPAARVGTHLLQVGRAVALALSG